MNTRRRRHSMSVLLGVLLLLLGACSGANDATSDVRYEQSAATEGGASVPAPEAATGGDGELAAGDDTLGSGGAEVVVLRTQGRDIIFTADLTVAVTDVASAGMEATQAIESLGGFLFGQQTTGAPEPSSVLTFKILPEDFQEALARLGSIGEVRTQSVTADDVTERVVDLQSRIDTAAASVARLKGFLEEATDIDAIAALESQLLQRETDLETMRGQLRTLQDRVDLATIVLRLTEALSRPDLQLALSGYPGHDDGVSCPSDEGSVRVEAGEAATICFEIVNAGDTPLAGFALDDAVLGVELDDLIAVYGDPDAVLEPGQSLVLAAEVDVERNLRTRTRVSAQPVDQDGNRLEGREVADTVTMSIDSIDPGGLPGFRDGLEASWNALLAIGGLLLLIGAAALPFIWVIPLAWLAWLWTRRRGRRATATPGAEQAGDEPGVGPANRSE
jgi:hypothetical protein